MIPLNNILLILVNCFSLCVFCTSIAIPAYAAQESHVVVSQNSLSQIAGEVTNVIRTDRFTYVEVKTDKGQVWAAGPVQTINIGDLIAFSASMPMHNFRSKNLNRDFTLIYFTSSYQTDKKTSAAYSSYDQINQQKIISPRTESIESRAAELEIGDYLGVVKLDSLNGQSKSFSAYQGKPLIINIWASWCGPCRSEMDSLERLSHWNSGKDFNIIGISTDDYRNRAAAFIKQTEITFENFIDHKLLLENMLGAKTIPLTVLVDADGRVLKKIRGALKWDSPEIINEVVKIFHLKTNQ